MDVIHTSDKLGQKKAIQKAGAPTENKKGAEKSRRREKWHQMTRADNQLVLMESTE